MLPSDTKRLTRLQLAANLSESGALTPVQPQGVSLTQFGAALNLPPPQAALLADPQEAQWLTRALALVDGTQFVTEQGGATPLPRHPLSGRSLYLNTAPPPSTAQVAPQDWAAWSQERWLPRCHRLTTLTHAPFPLANAAMPDHALWHRADMAVAFADAIARDPDDRPALLTLGFGEPQTFLAVARKAQDLWAGSFIISWMNAVALATLIQQEVICPEAIVFPSVRGDALFLGQLHLLLSGSSPALGVKKKDQNQGPFLDDALLCLAQHIQNSTQSTQWAGYATAIRGLVDAHFHRSPSLPNRALLLVPAESSEAIAEAYHNALNDAWDRLGGAALERFKAHCQCIGHPLGKETTKLWQSQIKDVHPFSWGALHLPTGSQELTVLQGELGQIFTEAKGWLKNHNKLVSTWIHRQSEQDPARSAREIGSNYGPFAAAASRFAEAARGARIQSTPTGGAWEKDTLTGDREQMIPESLHPASLGHPPSQRDVKVFWKAVYDGQGGPGGALKRGTLKENERLSALGLTKRLFANQISGLQNLPSTAHLATRAWAARLMTTLMDGGTGSGETESLRHSLLLALQAFNEARDAFIQAAVPGSGAPFGNWAELKEVIGEHPLPQLSSPEAQALRVLNKRDRGFLFEDEYILPPLSPIERRDAKRLQFYKMAEKAATEGLKALRRLIRAAKEAGLPAPTRYYALLFFDGDAMGKWVSGQNAPLLKDLLTEAQPVKATTTQAGAEATRPLTPAHQAAFSESLGNYNALARRLVESAFGTAVYAGGDDLLALTPVETAMELSQKLRLLFSGFIDVQAAQRLHAPIPLNQWVNALPAHVGVDSLENAGVFRDRGGVLPSPSGALSSGPYPWLLPGATASLSGGLVIAHEKASLALTLAEARQAERRAKDGMGRNSLALSVIKRSGETLKVGIRLLPSPSQQPPARGAPQPLPLEIFQGLAAAMTPGPHGFRSLSTRYPTRIREAVWSLLPTSLDRFCQNPGALLPIIHANLAWAGGRQVYRSPEGGKPWQRELQAQGQQAVHNYLHLGKSLQFPPFSGGALEEMTPIRDGNLGLSIEEWVLWPSVLSFLVREER